MSWKLKEKARSLLQEEEGTIIKPWGDKISVALVYPNYYHVGMANLGFQSVYFTINSLPYAVCERFFLPEKGDFKEFQRTSTPLFSLESQAPLGSFDIIAFSLSFENDYANILAILDLGGIPLRHSRRKDAHPIVLAGGITTFLNPEPLADFMDLFILGEAEEVLPECLSEIKTARTLQNSRTHLVARLSAIEGVYVPYFYAVSYGEDGTLASFVPQKKVPSRVKRRWIQKVDSHVTRSIVTSPLMEFGGMYLVEISRGCCYDCRFCATGWIYRPVRPRSLKSLTPAIEKGLQSSKKIGLVSAAVSDHPEINGICDFIRERGGGLSVSSLRLNALKKELLSALQESGHQSVTLAPETGSERLRAVIKKHISNQDIFDAVELVALCKIPNLRLYFLVGLPTESMSDIEEIVALTKKIKHTMISSLKRKTLPGAITLCITPFVPKPFTPFQWVPFENLSLLRRKINHIQNGLRKERQVLVTFDLPKWAYVQALLSRGDRRVGKILLAVHENGGNWNQAFQMTDINPDFYVYRHRELTELLPWDFIDHGLKKEKLIAEYHQALTEK
ncbi:MAG: radical SAM protein [Deltaproteobacteria bacterium]|nr:radical SAM protein [Deltaproteobacteria bacterium]